MNPILNLLRFLVGRMVLLMHLLSLPKKGKRASTELDQLKTPLQKLSLYQFVACPFCVKVRRQMRRLNLDIECRDARKNQIFRKELLAEGGALKVPCLRIEEANGAVRWLYESSDINQYLQQAFPLESLSH